MIHLFLKKAIATLAYPLPILCVGFTVLLVNVVSPVFAQSEITFSEQEVNAIIAHGPWPTTVPSDQGNELSGLGWAEKLGESLFFDTTLSADQSVACASCHQPENGFSDLLPVGIGLERGARNTQGLLDVGLQRWFGWDGGADSLWAASLRPLFNAHEMGAKTGALAKTLRANQIVSSALESNYIGQPIGEKLKSDANTNNTNSLATISDEQLAVLAGKSIAAFMRTLVSERTEFDDFREALANNDVDAQSAYSESAKRGLKLFVGEANCRACHFGANFSNGEFHDTGRPFFTDVGQVDPGRYTGIQRVRQDQFNLLGEYGKDSAYTEKLKTSEVKLSQINWGQWRTPSLRNLEKTGPYMHDGSLETLRDVIDAYADIDIDRLHSKGESILKPLDLNNAQRDDLVNFLRSLSAGM